jgi:hypothetical protein
MGGQETMKLFGEVILLELQREEWESDRKANRIVLPASVTEKEDGKMGEKIPWHYFVVVDKGPLADQVEIGDRLMPYPPDMQHQPQLIPVMMWIKGKKVTRYIISQSNIGGVEDKVDEKKN